MARGERAGRRGGSASGPSARSCARPRNYGADALVEVHFEADEVAGADIDGVPLSRIVAARLAPSASPCG